MLVRNFEAINPSLCIWQKFEKQKSKWIVLGYYKSKKIVKSSVKVHLHYSCGMLAFWNMVKDELDYKLMSQKELSAATEISYNTIQSWITKDRLPDAADAVKIASVLGVSVEYLVTGIEGPNRQENKEINAIVHDLRHLRAEDLDLAKTLVHRLTLTKV